MAAWLSIDVERETLLRCAMVEREELLHFEGGFLELSNFNILFKICKVGAGHVFALEPHC